MKIITDKQWRMVHILATRLGLDDEIYRDFLRNYCMVESAKEFTIGQNQRRMPALIFITTTGRSIVEGGKRSDKKVSLKPI